MESTAFFSLQLINANLFKLLLGIDHPKASISDTTYAALDYLFYALNERPSEISGHFPLLSVGALNKPKSTSSDMRGDEIDLWFPTVLIQNGGDTPQDSTELAQDDFGKETLSPPMLVGAREHILQLFQAD